MSTRTISRQVTNTVPAWRSAMSVEDTLYPIGNAPSTLLALMSYPGGSFITNMDGGGDGTPEMQHRGWGSTWYVPDAGMHGTMVFGRTGEFTMENQRSAIPLSDNPPNWEWWQQPYACLSEAEADAADADFYFNVADWDAIKAATPNRIVAGASWGSWDGVFPVGMQESVQRGWIVRRKVKWNSFGNGHTARYRYDLHCTIPASWTGTGAAALVMNPHVLGGPNQSWTGRPSGATAAQWNHELWATSGEVKAWLNFENSITKVRSFAPVPIPEFGVYAIGWVCKHSATKRLYWVMSSSTVGWGYWYADFSDGIAGMTASAFVALTLEGADFSLSDATGGGFTDGHPTDKRVGYYLRFGDTTNHLVVADFGQGKIKALTGLETYGLTWARTSGGLRPAFVYVPATNQMLIIEHSTVSGTPEIWVHRFTIPSDPLDATQYTFTKAKLSLGSGAVVDQPDYMMGERATIIETLGCIVLPQYSSPPLAFIPS